MLTREQLGSLNKVMFVRQSFLDLRSLGVGGLVRFGQRGFVGVGADRGGGRKNEKFRFRVNSIHKKLLIINTIKRTKVRQTLS